MAAPVGTIQSYDQVGIREQLADVIYNVDREETPLFSSLGKGKAVSRHPNWQTDTLRDSAVNAQLEGDDITTVARSPTTRLENWTQIFSNPVVVSDTDIAMNKAGRGKEMAYQLVKVGKEQRLDIEKALFDNQAAVAPTSAVAGQLAGLPAWITTNTVVGSGGADPTGDGTDARTDGTQTAFSQAKFDGAMRSIVEQSNSTKEKKVYLSPFMMDAALGFTGNNNQRSDIAAGKVTNDLVAYRTPWGTVKFQMSTECRPRDVFILDESMWEVLQARPMATKTLGKTGDNEKRFIVTELTLCAKNEKTSAIIADNTTS